MLLVQPDEEPLGFGANGPGRVCLELLPDARGRFFATKDLDKAGHEAVGVPEQEGVVRDQGAEGGMFREAEAVLPGDGEVGSRSESFGERHGKLRDEQFVEHVAAGRQVTAGATVLGCRVAGALLEHPQALLREDVDIRLADASAFEDGEVFVRHERLEVHAGGTVAVEEVRELASDVGGEGGSMLSEELEDMTGMTGVLSGGTEFETGGLGRLLEDVVGCLHGP